MRELKNSDFIVPLSIFVYLGILNGLLYFSTPHTYLDPFTVIYNTVLGLVIIYFLAYQSTENKDRFTGNFRKTFHLCAIYGLVYFALFRPKELTYDSFFLLVVCAVGYSLSIGYHALSPRLTSLATILTKVASFGYLFFKQKRPEFSHKGFSTYKYPSPMGSKSNIHLPIIDIIIRKTSINEFPQLMLAKPFF